ncbi:MAG: sigma factor-like helix-turn-helix DNA-binding protein [Alphaproteobacteria bacterium]
MTDKKFKKPDYIELNKNLALIRDPNTSERDKDRIKQALFNRFKGMLDSYAMRIKNIEGSMEDRQSECYTMFFDILNQYDPEKEGAAKFPYYLKTYMKFYMQNLNKRKTQSRNVKDTFLLAHMHNAEKKISAEFPHLSSEEREEKLIQAFAEARLGNGTPIFNSRKDIEEKIKGYRQARLSMYGLSNPVVMQDPDGADFISTLIDPNADEGFRTLAQEQQITLIREVIENAFSGLPERTAYILTQRLLAGTLNESEGLPVKTLDVLGKELNLSKERIRQIENSAKNQLRIQFQKYARQTGVREIFGVKITQGIQEPTKTARKKPKTIEADTLEP